MNKKRRAVPPSKIRVPRKAAHEKHHKNSSINDRSSQRERLLSELLAGPISTIDAVYDLGILHPANSIHLLRLQGHNVVTILKPAILPDGRRIHCAHYMLLPDGISIADLLGERPRP